MIFHVPDRGQHYEIGERVRVVRSPRHVDLIGDPNGDQEIVQCEPSRIDSGDEVTFLLIQTRPRRDP